MPLKLTLPHPALVTPSPLTQAAFAPFGAVAENPRPELTPFVASNIATTTTTNTTTADAGAGTSAGSVTTQNYILANQGTAIKYPRASPLVNLYPRAPSKKPGEGVCSVFVCGERQTFTLSHARQGQGHGQGESTKEMIIPVPILERHPFTTQTFSPLASGAACSARYLVVVAPSLSPSDADSQFPSPLSSSSSESLGDAYPGSLEGHPGRGLPDMSNLRAFVAHPGQAVTYAPGTWHAPMIVLPFPQLPGIGEGGRQQKTLPFFVVQYANGVSDEDCQEVEYDGVGVQVGAVARL